MTQGQRYYYANKEYSHRRSEEWKNRNPLYRIWIDMNRRCKNPMRPDYPRWGGRGIKVLFNSYKEFAEYIGPRPSIRHTIDRINNDGHYAPGNIRWATKSEQNFNRRPYAKSTKV